MGSPARALARVYECIMHRDLRDALIRVASPAVTIALTLAIARARRLTLVNDLGLRAPPPGQAALWSLVFVALAVGQEVAGEALGWPAPEPWRDKYAGPALAARVAGIVVLAPVAEELLFRGLLFRVIARSPLKQAGAIAVTAALFAASHLQYDRRALGLILLEGVCYGAIRASTGSTLLTMGIHAAANGYAVYQRISG